MPLRREPRIRVEQMQIAPGLGRSEADHVPAPAFGLAERVVELGDPLRIECGPVVVVAVAPRREVARERRSPNRGILLRIELRAPGARAVDVPGDAGREPADDA